MTLVLYYFQNCLGESADTPNAFYLPPNSADITFGSFLNHFPVKDPNLHFRVKCNDPTTGYVWRDVTTKDQPLPTYQDAIFLKILRHDRAIIEKQLRVLALQKSVASKANVSTFPTGSSKGNADNASKNQSSASAPSPVRLQKPNTTSSSANQPSTPTAPTAATPSPTGAPITRQPSVDMLDFGSPANPSAKASSGAIASQSSSSGANVNIDIDTSAPILSRDELAARRQADIDAQVQAALDEKKKRDEAEAQKALEVENAKEKHERNLTAWAINNKEKRNIRTLLTTMHTVLWPGNTWKPIGLGDVIEASKVKLNYRKAMLVVHPDRCSHLDSEIQFIAKRCFEAINEAYDVFLAKEGV